MKYKLIILLCINTACLMSVSLINDFAQSLKMIGEEVKITSEEEQVVSEEKLLEKARYYTNKINFFGKNNSPEQKELADVLFFMANNKDDTWYANFQKLAIKLIENLKTSVNFDIDYALTTKITTPLILAVNAQNLAITEALIKKGANPVRITKEKGIQNDFTEKSPLTFAIQRLSSLQNKNLETIIQELINATDNIDTEFTDQTFYESSKKTALLLALEKDNDDVIKMILTKGANPLKITKTILYANNEQDSITTSPLTKVLNIISQEPFNNQKLLDRANLLIDHIVENPNISITNTTNVGEQITTPLLLAIKSCDTNLVKKLYDLKIRADLFPEKPITIQKIFNNNQLTTTTPLIFALSSAKYKDVALFIINQAKKLDDVNLAATEDDGNDIKTTTPLLRAISLHDIDLIKALIAKGADPLVKIKIQSNKNVETTGFYQMLDKVAMEVQYKEILLNIIASSKKSGNPITKNTIIYQEGMKTTEIQDMLSQLPESMQQEFTKALA